MIVTFYSFKGGVGRSMALAHVADLLCRRGLKVLVIDFDLEAPGLERYFDIDYAAARRNVGVIDLLLSFKHELSGRALDGGEPHFRELERFLYPVYPGGRDSGSLYLLPAGRRDSAAEMRRYALEVRTFDWQDFQYNWEGEAFFEWLRQTVTSGEHGFDVVLVDSRTGVTEMGGICAFRLSDAVVMLCAANHQNISGTRSVADDFTSPQVLALRRNRPLDLVIVPARVELRDESLLADFNRRFSEAFRKDEPEAFRRIGLSFTDLAIPYEPAFAFEERVASAPEEHAGRRHIEVAFERLADAVTLLAGEGKLQELAEDARMRLSGTDTGEPATSPPEKRYDPASRFAGHDVYLSSPGQEPAADMLASALRDRQLSVFFADMHAKPNQALPETLAEALRHSRHLVLCAGRSGISHRQKKEVASVREGARRIRIVPVLLPGAESDIFSLTLHGMADLQSFDLRDWQMQDAAFELLVATLGSTPSDESSTSLREEAAGWSPYPGLQPYGEEREGDFFGRVNEIAHALARLAGNRIVTVQGPSGSGKTSLVLAGLFPRLRRGALEGSADWELSRIALDAAGWDTALEQFIAASGARQRLLFIDQIDALETARQMEAYGGLLEAVVKAAGEPAHGLRLILGWRKTASTGIRAALPRMAEALAMAPVEVTVPGDDIRRQAIEKPAAKSGRILEPGLPERLLSDAGEGPSALSLLQMALPRLWEEQRRGWLTNAAYDRMGGIAAVFGRQMASVYNALSADEQDAMKSLLLRLVQTDKAPNAFRARSANWEQVRTQPDLRTHGPNVLAILADARLVVLAADDSTGTVQVTLGHGLQSVPDLLLLGWAREEHALLKWRDMLEAGLLEWKATRMDQGALLAGALLDEARHMAEKHSASLIVDEWNYIRASAARRAAFRKQVAKVGGAVAAVVIAILALVVQLQQSRLDSQLAAVQGPALQSASDVLQSAIAQFDKLPGDDRQQAKQVLESTRAQLSKADLSPEAAALIASTGAKAESAVADGDLQKARLSLEEARAKLAREMPATAATENAQVYLQYTDEADAGVVGAVSQALGTRWKLTQSELRAEATCGDVRFFYGNDKDNADRLRAELIVTLARRGIALEPRLLDLSGRFSGVRPGTLEIWLPPLGDLKARDAKRRNDIDGAELRTIPAGCFTRGSRRSERLALLKQLDNSKDLDWYNREFPKREIWQGAFYIYKHEVTNEQFSLFQTASCSKGAQYQCPGWKARGEPRHPARFVAWRTADAYCRWAGGRLPTEDEWEKAARGTDGRIWPWGNEQDASRFRGNMKPADGPVEVGSYPQGDSPYGVSDMAGNLWEMTSGRWDDDSHAMKGGSYLNTLADTRASARWATSQEARGAEYLGFRCVHPIAGTGPVEAPKAE